ncbi:histidine phosphatase family protein [uncultured Croceitalea sp.]|uniref:histidine phosphatase family protein n=1 Tax=uncultured Croceitalea sp. TaxID=1798908 RepID=UPI00374F5045
MSYKTKKQFIRINTTKNILSVLVLVFFLSFLSGCKQDKEEPAKDPIISTFYLIRHAEKDRTDPTNSNPELNQDGLGRAIKWAEVFEPIDLDAIYSTNYERTSMTAAPTSIKKDIDVKYYNPSEIDIEVLKAENLSKNILIVGHSNTTPVMANKLLGYEKYEQMDDTDNGSLFIIRIIDSVATEIRLNMN